MDTFRKGLAPSVSSQDVWPIFLVFAAVAGEHYFLVWMHHHGAELARAYAPCAAVAGFLVNYDYSRVFFLT